MREPNRLLTDEEIRALPDGKKIYTEERRYSLLSGSGIKQGNKIVGVNTGMTYDLDDDWRNVRLHANDARAWLRKPTKEEKAANPWPAKEDGGNEETPKVDS